MRRLVAALAFICIHAVISAQSPITATVRTEPRAFTVLIALDGSSDNIHVQVATTALDRRPTDWAGDTVFHQYLLLSGEDGQRQSEEVVTAFEDPWPNMPPGQYSIAVSLTRIGVLKPIEIPPIDVRVRP